MKYFISLAGVPDWAVKSLLQSILEKKEKDNLDLNMTDHPGSHTGFADFPAELLIEGSKAALAFVIPFIYDWLVKKRIKCEIRREGDKEIITISGHGIDKIIEVKEKLLTEVKRNEPER